MQKYFFKGRNLIDYAFEENIFPLPKKEIPQHGEWPEEEKPENTVSELNKQIIEKEKKINKELFKNTLDFKVYLIWKKK